MIKKFLRYTISLPFTVVFCALALITLYIVFGFMAIFTYILAGFDNGIIKHIMEIPNHFKNASLELIEDLINGL